MNDALSLIFHSCSLSRTWWSRWRSMTLSIRKCRTCLVVNCSGLHWCCAWANRPTCTSSMNPRPILILSSVWWPLKSLNASFSTPKRLPLSSSTISSWRRTWPIELSSSKDSLQERRRHTRRRPSYPEWTAFWKCSASLSDAILITSDLGSTRNFRLRYHSPSW